MLKATFSITKPVLFVLLLNIVVLVHRVVYTLNMHFYGVSV